VATFTGTSDSDTIVGSTNSDTIDGGAGNDNLSGSAGDDTVTGGRGKDTIDLGDGNDLLIFSQNDLVDNSEFYGNWRFSQITDIINGGEGTDTIAFNDRYTNYDITRANISNIEILDLRADDSDPNYGLNVALNIDQLKSFVTVDALPGTHSYNYLTFDWFEPNQLEQYAAIVLKPTTTPNELLDYTTATLDLSNSSYVNFDIPYFKVDGYILDITASNEMLYVKADAGNDKLTGGIADDNLDGQAGDDSISGMAGNDTVLGGSGDDSLAGGAGDDTVYGDTGDDTISGDEGDDLLYGGQGNDIIDGGAGADRLKIEYGNDSYFGGIGNDIFELTDAQGTGSIDGGDGIDQIQASKTYDLTQYNINNVEKIVLYGRADVKITAEQFEAIEIEIDDSATPDARYSIIMSETGTIDLNELPTVLGLGGSDGDDTITGNALNNSLTGEAGADNIDGGSGNDSLQGGAGPDTLIGGDGRDKLYGGIGRDTLKGDSGNDYLQGGPDKDVIDGGTGDDTVMLYFDHNNLSNSDWVNSNQYIDGLSQYRNNDELSGGAGSDTLRFEAQYLDTNYNLDLTGAILSNFETIEIGTTSLISITSAQLASWLDTSIVLKATDAQTFNPTHINQDGLIYHDGIRESIFEFDYANLNDYELTGNFNSKIISENKDTANNIVDYQENKVYSALSIEGDGAVEIDKLWETRRYIFEDGDGFQVTVEADNSRDNHIWVKGGASTVTTGIGDDFIYGSADAEALSGGAGDDVIKPYLGSDLVHGNAGNDRIELVAANNQAEIYGDAGNDIFEFKAYQALANTNWDGKTSAKVDGGTGDDVLILSTGDIDLSNYSFTNIETIKITQDGVYILPKSFLDSIDTANIKQSDNASDVAILGRLTSATTIDLSGNLQPQGVAGSDEADIITGGTGADTLLGNSGNDVINGGPGNDIIRGGKGSDILSGGPGNDVFTITEDEVVALGDWKNTINGTQIYHSYRELLNVDSINGGDGADTVTLKFDDYFNGEAIYFSKDSLSDIETVDFDGTPYYLNLIIDAAAWNTVSNWNLHGRDGVYNYLTIIGDGSDINFTALESDFNIEGQGIQLNGSFGTVDLNNIVATIDNFNITSLDSLIGSASDDSVVVKDRSIDFLGAAGDDRLTINFEDIYNYSGYENHQTTLSVEGNIDGGTGNDTLAFSNTYSRLIDLSSAVLKNFETIDNGSSAVIVTAEQYNSLSFSGDGPVLKDINGVLYGSDVNDSFSGDGTNQFKPGSGDDTVSRVSSVLFDGNQANFTITRNPDSPSTLTVEHSGGDSSQGTDTVSQVLSLNFSDGSSFTVDDHHDFITPQSRDLTYDEVVTANFEHRQDVDYFKTTLVPSSPLILESNAGDSAFRIWATDVDSGSQLSFKNITHSWVSNWLNSGDTDDWLPGFNTASGFQIYQGGDVTFRVETSEWTWGDQPSQNYDFALKLVDDYSDTESTRGEIDPTSGLITGYIGDLDDVDWIKTELVAGTTYLFDLQGQSSQKGTLADPELAIYQATNLGEPVAAIPTGNAIGDNVQLQYYASTSGTFYLAVSDATGLYKGSYTLSQKSLDQQSADIATTGRIEFNNLGIGSVVGEINELADRDWYKVQLEKGFAYKVEALGVSSNEGTLIDPYVEVRSASGILLNSSSTGGIGNNAQLYFQAPEDGTYFLAAAAAGNSGQGTYTLRLSGIADDFEGGRSTNKVLAIGEVESGLIHVGNDSDWFKVGLSAGETYVIDVTADRSSAAELDPLQDPFVAIRDDNGKIVAYNDDANGSFNAQLFFTADQTGVYFVEARSAFKYDTGAYKIVVDKAPDDDFANGLNDGKTSIGSLLVDTPMEGAIKTPGDTDWFAVEMDVDITYKLLINGISDAGGSLLDPALRLFDSNGNLIEYADDGGLGTNSLTYFTAPSAGKYYIEVSSDDNQSLGDYTLSAVKTALPADDVGDGVGTGKAMELGESFVGNLLKRGDEDWFEVNLLTDNRYVFKLQGAATGGGTLADPYLELRSANGTLLSEDDNGSWQNDSVISYQSQTTGTYYLVAKTLDTDATGTYTFSTRAPDDHGSTIGQATTINLNETVNGEIQWSDGRFGGKANKFENTVVDRDEDWFAIDLDAEQVVTFTATPTATGGLARALIEVVDPFATPIARGDGKEVDDGAAMATLKASSTGTYYARVIDGAGTTGAYTLSVVPGDASDEDSVAPINLSFNAENEAFRVGKIGIAGDEDQYQIDLLANNTYRIEIVSARDGLVAPIEDSQLTLLWTADTNGAEAVAIEAMQNESGSTSRMASAEFSALESGQLAITVSPGSEQDTGQYAIRVLDLGVNGGDEAVDRVTDYDSVTGKSLVLGDSLSAALQTSNDTDLFAINLESAQRFSVSIKGYDAGEGTLAYANVTLLTATGGVVASSYSNADGIAKIDATVIDSGRYYIKVDGAGIEANSGTYLIETQALQSSDETDDIPGNLLTLASVAPGKMLETDISFAGDVDWAKANLKADTNYVVDVLAAGTNLGSLADSYLQVFNSQGELISSDHDSGAGLDSRIKLSVSSDENVYFAVSGTGDAQGTYKIRLREMYTGEYDPLANQQWYRDSLKVSDLGGEYTGAGITIGVIDDGVDYGHPDLAKQLDLSIDYDAQYRSDTGEHKWPPLPFLPPDDHGTPVAGIMVAEANNETGIVGLSPDADVASFRVKWSSPHISGALARQNQVDVSNNSWGAINPFSDDFSSVNHMADYASIRYAVETGRDGLGTVFVFSAGNSRTSGDNVNHHNFQNARETVTVGSVSPNDMVSSFSTPGSAILVSAYGENIFTTDRIGTDGINRSAGDAGDYTSFGGTSAAAPEVSAIVALMLEANPLLGYRDVQAILAHSATHPDSAAWKVNAASNHNLGGMSFNDDMGFGIVDAHAAVRLAEAWQTSKTAHNEAYAGTRLLDIAETIADGDQQGGYVANFEIGSNIQVEHLELGIDIRHERLGDLTIDVISPNGTISNLLDRPTATEGRPFGLVGEYSGLPNHLMFDLSSAQFYGEDGQGTWQVIVRDVRAEETGKVYGLSLRLYGASNEQDNQYIFTDEFAMRSEGTLVLQDDTGTDWINTAAVTSSSDIDLMAGTLDIAGQQASIQSWVQIENIVAGDGDDRLVGNHLNNTLIGGRGDDILLGSLGNDILQGGSGRDTVIYDGNYGDYALLFDNTDQTLTVTTNAIVDNEVVTYSDALSGIESVHFADQQLNLSVNLGNTAPIVNKVILDKPLQVTDHADFELTVPKDAFSDAESAAAELTLSAAIEGDLELPEWMSFDPVTGKLVGSPPEGVTGRYKVVIDATDDFGDSASQTIEVEIGDNRAPIVDTPKSLEIEEDSAAVLLNIGLPTDPEEGSLTVTITGVPSQGEIQHGTSGAVIELDDIISLNQLTDLVFIPAKNFVGNAGKLEYKVTDDGGVNSSSHISFLIEAVNDAPTFGPNAIQDVEFTGSLTQIELSIPAPTDAEESINIVTVSGLPEYGSILDADGNVIEIGDELFVNQLDSIKYSLSTNINGPVGELVLSATDSQGLSGEWRLMLQVNGEATLSSGSNSADQLYGSVDIDKIFGLGGNDQILSNAGDDIIYAGSGSDVVYAGLGADTIYGGGGDDYIDGGSGADVMLGGPGNDRYIVEDENDLVVETIARGAGGYDTIETKLDIVAPANIEALEALGSDPINLSGNSLNNLLVGNSGDNELFGENGSDILIGNTGSDILNGGSGRDRMLGGEDDDIYYVDSRSDRITESAHQGYDEVISTSSYVLSSHVEKLTLSGEFALLAGGNSLDNTLVGNDLDNTLNGGLGADIMMGGLGNDTYIVDNIADVVEDSGGVDIVKTKIDYTLGTNIENLKLIGLLDTHGNGNELDNMISGNSGDNLLDGGPGSDLLTGGAGGDGFILANKDGIDTIVDFESGIDLILVDAIEFELFDPNTLQGHTDGIVSDNDFAIVELGDILDSESEATFIFDKNDGSLSIDVDGSDLTEAIKIADFDEQQSDELRASDLYILL